ncbi:MAG: lipid-binding SYLF domain-containing protein [Candidatus Competibacterales bacterium]
MRPMKNPLFGLIIALLTFGLVATAWADEAKDAASAAEVVARAETTLGNFLSDPDTGAARDVLRRAKGAFIVAEVVKAGFIFGGSGGTGVLLAKDEATGEWSSPAFYSFGTASIGLQAGVQVSEILMLVMTEKAMDAMLSGEFEIGGNITATAGPSGGGASRDITADFVGFNRSKGVFGGLTLDGAVVQPRDTLNKAYYGEAVSPADILVRRNVPAKAPSLRQALAAATQ